MIINKTIKKYLVLSLIITVCVSFTFCDFKKEESQNKLYNNEAVYDRVKTNIEEAKVLSDISMLNETIIALSSLSLEKSSVYGIKTISNKLKKDNMEIRRSLNELAEKKLILLPIRLDEKEINELSKIDDTSFSKVYLNKVKELLESEITELEYLSTITNDLDFRVLTVKALVKLNYNLYQTHKILK